MALHEATYAVDDDERALIQATARHASSVLVGPADRQQELVGRLPPRFVGSLRALADGSVSTGFCLIRGLGPAIGPLPPTPAGHSGMLLPNHWTTGLVALTAHVVGSLVGYAEEKDGALIQEVHPVRGEEHRIENSGSVDFGFHTENVHHPLRPDLLGLLCLRQDHDRTATLRVASVREAATYMTVGETEVLRSARFRSFYPSSFTRDHGGPRPHTSAHPVLFGPPSQPFMRFNAHNTVAVDPDAATALAALGYALEKVCREVVLEPGDLVVLDNHVVGHGRSGFRARHDGADRWLRRFYALRGIPGWVRTMMPRPAVLPPLHELVGGLA
jgi:L-asparagine oxygenase